MTIKVEEGSTLAHEKEPGKRQVSFYLDTALIERLDAWLKWQLDHRGYNVDRSHVLNVLLRRFLEKNSRHIDKDKPRK